MTINHRHSPLGISHIASFVKLVATNNYTLNLEIIRFAPAPTHSNLSNQQAYAEEALHNKNNTPAVSRTRVRSRYTIKNTIIHRPIAQKNRNSPTPIRPLSHYYAHFASVTFYPLSDREEVKIWCTFCFPHGDGFGKGIYLSRGGNTARVPCVKCVCVWDIGRRYFRKLLGSVRTVTRRFQNVQLIYSYLPIFFIEDLVQ